MGEDYSLNCAVRNLGLATGGRFDIYALAGDRNSKYRAEIMRTLTGEKIPVSKCGVNALTREFHARLQITGNCIAERESNFVTACKSIAYPHSDVSPLTELLAVRGCELAEREVEECVSSAPFALEFQGGARNLGGEQLALLDVSKLPAEPARDPRQTELF